LEINILLQGVRKILISASVLSSGLGKHFSSHLTWLEVDEKKNPVELNDTDVEQTSEPIFGPNLTWGGAAT